MVLSKLKPGITVYDVRKTSGISRLNNSKWVWWSVLVKEIDVENEKVLASWSGNADKWYFKRSWSKWRLKIPED